MRRVTGSLARARSACAAERFGSGGTPACLVIPTRGKEKGGDRFRRETGIACLGICTSSADSLRCADLVALQRVPPARELQRRRILEPAFASVALISFFPLLSVLRV